LHGLETNTETKLYFGNQQKQVSSDGQRALEFEQIVDNKCCRSHFGAVLSTLRLGNSSYFSHEIKPVPSFYAWLNCVTRNVTTVDGEGVISEMFRKGAVELALRLVGTIESAKTRHRK
jgi:hypothetical protein